MAHPSYGTDTALPKFLRIFLFLALVSLPVALAVAPVSFFAAGHSLCLVKNLFHLPCPGCGMTRALSCVLHGRFLEAYYFNPLVIMLFPLLSFIWIKTVVREWREIKFRCWS